MEIKREVSKKFEVKDYDCKVLDVRLFDNKTFLLEISKPKGFSFTAGQFAMIHIHGSQKPFSIASPPSLKTLQFLIKEHDDGTVTPYLDDLKKGETLRITAPYGAFCIRETKAKEIYFIAAGTGVAPFRSMICDFLERKSDVKITLLYGFRTECLFGEVFQEIEKDHKNFRAICSSSKPKADWDGERGRVTEHLKDVIGEADGKEVYLCGMKAMVEDSKRILIEELGFDEKKIHLERW